MELIAHLLMRYQATKMQLKLVYILLQVLLHLLQKGEHRVDCLQQLASHAAVASSEILFPEHPCQLHTKSSFTHNNNICVEDS